MFSLSYKTGQFQLLIFASRNMTYEEILLCDTT